MKKLFICLFAVLMLTGCDDGAPTPTLEPEGEETIITEKVITENEITWDNVPMQTW